MKRALLTIIFMVIALTVFVFASSAKEAQLEKIPDDLKLPSDPEEAYFVVFEGTEYFGTDVYSGKTRIVSLNADAIKDQLDSLGVETLGSVDSNGKLYLTKFIFPDKTDSGVTIQHVHFNKFKNSTYFSNCGYVEMPGCINEVTDMNQHNYKLRCIDFGKNSQIASFPYLFCADTGSLRRIKNFPTEKLTTISKSAFSGLVNVRFDNDVLVINAGTIGEGAFNNSLFHVKGLVFGENLMTVGNQSLCNRKSEFTCVCGNTHTRADLEFVEFYGDVSKISISAIGNDKGVFYFANGSGNPRSEYANLKCVILHANDVTEGSTIGDFNQNIAFNSAQGDFPVKSAHDTESSITYTDYSSEGTKASTCKDCHKSERTTIPAIFTAVGYSVKENDSLGIISGYTINVTALREYETANGKLTFGIIMANSNFGEATEFMSKNTEGKYVLNNTYGIQLEVRNRDFAKINATVDQFTKDEASLNLIMALYVVDENGVSYVQKDGDYAGTVKKGETTLDVVTIVKIAELSEVELPFVVPTQPAEIKENL